MHIIQTLPLSKPSSQIAEAGYDPHSKTLAVQFQNRDVWHYSPVAEHEYLALTEAPSAGKYFNAHIKGHKEAVKQ